MSERSSRQATTSIRAAAERDERGAEQRVAREVEQEVLRLGVPGQDDRAEPAERLLRADARAGARSCSRCGAGRRSAAGRECSSRPGTVPAKRARPWASRVTRSAKRADLVEALRRPHDRGAAPGAVLHEPADAPRALRVEIVRRLVHEQDGRIGDERPRDREPLLHPVRVLADGPAGRLRESDVVEELLARGRTPRAGGSRCSRAKNDEVLEPGDPQVEAAVAAGDEADEPAGLARPALDRAAEHAHRPRASASSAPRGAGASVVFPAPFGPSSAWISPGGTARDTPSSATVCPKRRTRSHASIAELRRLGRRRHRLVGRLLGNGRRPAVHAPPSLRPRSACSFRLDRGRPATPHDQRRSAETRIEGQNGKTGRGAST